MIGSEEGIDWAKVAEMDEYTLGGFAQELEEALHLDEAKQAYEILLKRQPQNVSALDHYTDCLDQLGLVDEMQKILSNYLQEQQLILNYERNYKLLFKYAQTQNGNAAIQYYNFGLQLLLPKAAAHPREVGDAYAAIAEIYQTDLLHLKESEQACLENINAAFRFDPTNLDAFLQLANFHLNKEDEAAAKQDMRLVYDRLSQSYDDYDEDFQLQVGKLLVEVELHEEAVAVLRRLVESDQSDQEYLYMLAFALWKQKQLSEAVKLVHGILAIGKNDEEIWQGTMELKEQLEKELGQLSQDATQSQTQQSQDDEWMDVE